MNVHWHNVVHTTFKRGQKLCILQKLVLVQMLHIYKLTTCETLEGANIAQNKLFALKIPSGVCGLLIRGLMWAGTVVKKQIAESTKSSNLQSEQPCRSADHSTKKTNEATLKHNCSISVRKTTRIQ